ncbi:hypothetical protein [Pseudomonas sp. S5D5]|uniref:hypothetical protein n=1 Tax=Pseudomonas sp. S5D5 TaxID=2083056 RepID=UPI0013001BF2|nr:hypothetical protein [Pseudomonas sp. S5D5]
MLISLMCSKCMEESIENSGVVPEGGLEIRTRAVPVQTVGLYRGICPNGHNVLMMADFQQFELLFESAMEAFADSYYRESVSSFAAALERFYEFSIYTLLISNGVEIDNIKKMWSSVSRQSERQLGLYVGLFTSVFGECPKLLSEKDAAFRNGVIHKGHFPSPTDCFDFGRVVYELLNYNIRVLRERFADSMFRAGEVNRHEASKQLKEGEIPIVFKMATTVSLMTLDEPLPMHEAMNAVSKRLALQRGQSQSLK